MLGKFRDGKSGTGKDFSIQNGLFVRRYEPLHGEADAQDLFVLCPECTFELYQFIAYGFDLGFTALKRD